MTISYPRNFSEGTRRFYLSRKGVTDKKPERVEFLLGIIVYNTISLRVVFLVYYTIQ